MNLVNGREFSYIGHFYYFPSTTITTTTTFLLFSPHHLISIFFPFSFSSSLADLVTERER